MELVSSYAHYSTAPVIGQLDAETGVTVCLSQTEREGGSGTHLADPWGAKIANKLPVFPQNADEHWLRTQILSD